MNDNHEKHHHIDSETKEKVSGRLKKIEGQIRAISKMVKEDVYCHEILNLFASVRAALNGARDLILEEHIEHCVAEEMTQNRHKATTELLSIFKKISK